MMIVLNVSPFKYMTILVIHVNFRGCNPYFFGINKTQNIKIEHNTLISPPSFQKKNTQIIFPMLEKWKGKCMIHQVIHAFFQKPPQSSNNRVVVSNIYFFKPLFGEMIQFDLRRFLQMG